MRWFTALLQMTRNAGSSATATLGTVPLVGHGGLTGGQLASAGASIATRPGLVTIDDVQHEHERFEAFVERVAADVQTRNLSGSYWDLQSAEIDAHEEQYSLAAEMERLDRVEGAAVVGWVVRNAALRMHNPITALARASEKVSVDALALAGTLLDSKQRLDPTDGGFLFSTRPRRDHRLRSRGRFGHLWIYGD